MNPVRKRPAYLFAKDFKIENVLGNLQGYKIASGQLEKRELDEVTKQHGSDEGVVFGSLITQAGNVTQGKHQLEDEDIQKSNKRRKRRKRRRKRNVVDDKPTTSVGICEISQPLAIPSSILEYGSSEDESDTGSHHSNKQENTNSSEDSSSEEDDQPSGGFFGLTTDHKVKPQSTHDALGEVSSNDTTDIDYERNEIAKYFENCSHPYPEVRTDIGEWNEEKHRYKPSTSSLSTYKCWKCKRIGHLAEDCTVLQYSSSSTSHHERFGRQSNKLNEYFKKCKTLKNSKDAKCSECSLRSNLVSCLDCGVIFCDGRGHLTDHLVSYPSHNKLYSFKLRKLIKCCKPTCSVVDATKLLMCSTCLSKQFNSHYNMINATWSRSGLKGIPNTLACEEHFQWHRINCANSMEEPLLSQEKLENAKQQNDGLLSEFYF